MRGHLAFCASFTEVILCGLAVLAVALEATGAAFVLGGIAAWMITHSA
jgi:hypothetical protein